MIVLTILPPCRYRGHNVPDVDMRLPQGGAVRSYYGGQAGFVLNVAHCEYQQRFDYLCDIKEKVVLRLLFNNLIVCLTKRQLIGTQVSQCLRTIGSDFEVSCNLRVRGLQIKETDIRSPIYLIDKSLTKYVLHLIYKSRIWDPRPRRAG